MTLRERNEWDKVYPFSIVKYDAIQEENRQVVDMVMETKKAIELDGLEEHEEVKKEGLEESLEGIKEWQKKEEDK